MKSLRKSLTGASKDPHRPLISTPLPLPTISKPPSSILPPSKVIRAAGPYKSQAPQELSFQKGDFFYVLKDDGGQWYEAHNPVNGARGLVPRRLFEEFNKGVASLNTSRASTTSASSTPEPMSSAPVKLLATPRGTKLQVYYAIVQHDFIAERQDELDAKRGEAITVVAQSNREWFVAKPIGKLGRPGLIPVSFVQIHDPVTGQPIQDVEELIDNGALPKVEEWKRAMISYKQNSITLGVIDSPASTPGPQAPTPSDPNIDIQGPTPIKPTYPPESGFVPPSDCLPDGILLSARVVSFHHEMSEYWFRVDAIFQPYGSSDEDLPLAKHLILFRAYNDFYDFQVSLLDTFPREAGRRPPDQRVLPYMPGPVDKVDDALTASRREELDVYTQDLCDLSKAGYRHILEHSVVRQFLALKPGDVENDVRSRGDDLHPTDQHDRLSERFGQLSVQPNARAKSDGSEYEDEGYAASPQQPFSERTQVLYTSDGERRPSQESTTKPHSQPKGHQRAGSAASSYRNPSPYNHSRSRSASPQQFDGPWNDSTYQSNLATIQQPNRQHSAYTHMPNPSMSSQRSSSHTTSSRSRPHPTAGTNINNPPISAANPQTAFVKIKIFDKGSDDLIAIRVHPRVSHAELMDKVNSRLGNGVNILKYRDSITNGFVELTSDEDLRIWMESADKHVLFAG